MPADVVPANFRHGARYAWTALLEAAREDERPALLESADLLFEFIDRVSQLFSDTYESTRPPAVVSDEERRALGLLGPGLLRRRARRRGPPARRAAGLRAERPLPAVRAVGARRCRSSTTPRSPPASAPSSVLATVGGTSCGGRGAATAFPGASSDLESARGARPGRGHAARRCCPRRSTSSGRSWTWPRATGPLRRGAARRPPRPSCCSASRRGWPPGCARASTASSPAATPSWRARSTR